MCFWYFYALRALQPETGRYARSNSTKGSALNACVNRIAKFQRCVSKKRHTLLFNNWKNQPIITLWCWRNWTPLKYKCAHITYKLLPHYLEKCRKWYFQVYSSVILMKQTFFCHFHNIYHFQTVNCGILPPYITVGVQSDLNLPQCSIICFTDAFIPAVHCGSADRIVAYNMQTLMLLPVHFEHSL